MKKNRFGINKTIIDQKQISGFRWWLFGGSVAYKPAIRITEIMQITGNYLGAENSPPIWRRLYYGYIYPFVRKWQLSRIKPNTTQCESLG